MALPSALSGSWNPFRVTGTPMPPNLLLMCKILAVALLATNHVRILPEPFLPFIPGLDRLIEPALFGTILQVVFLTSAIALLFNRWVRVNALVLGSCLLVAVVSSKAYYGNNKTFVGLALVLAGLSDFDRPPYLLRWQLALVYFGAAINKLLEPDWQSGVFFEYWAGEKLKNPVYIAVSGWLPPLVAGKLMCWGTMLAELACVIMLLVPRFVACGLWINILFQVGLLEFTGTTFTLFFYGMTAATLAFVTWPDRLLVFYNGKRGSSAFLRRSARLFDPDGLQDWRPFQGGTADRLSATSQGERLHLVDRDRAFAGFATVQRLLLFSPVFWLGVTALLALAPARAAGWRRCLVVAVLVFFLPFLQPLGEWLYRGLTGSGRSASPTPSPITPDHPQ